MKLYDAEAKARLIIGEELSAYRKSGGTIKALAAKSSLHPNTVSRLVYKETRFPRFATIYGILSAIGYEFVIKKQEPDPASASKNVVPSVRGTGTLRQKRGK